MVENKNMEIFQWTFFFIIKIDLKIIFRLTASVPAV